MTYYKYKALDEDTKQKLCSGAYSAEELEAVKNDIHSTIEAGKAKMKKVDIVLAIIFVVFVIFNFYDGNLFAAFAVSLFVFAALFLGRTIARWHSYGYLRWHYNQALKKGYPDTFENYSL